MVKRKTMPESDDATPQRRKVKRGKRAKPKPEPERIEVEPEKDEPIDAVPNESASLMQRVLWVRSRVTRLGKDATVKTGSGSQDNYKAISHDKVTAFIRPKMVQAGIFHSVDCIEYMDVDTGAKTAKGRSIVQHRALFRITFANVHNRLDNISVQQPAYADDYGDKAPGKATSYALKYALLKMFMIETGADDEARIEENDTGTGGGRAAQIGDDENMMANMYAKAEEYFGDDAPKFLAQMAARRFFKDTYAEIPQARYTEALQSLKTAHDHIRKEKQNAE